MIKINNNLKIFILVIILLFLIIFSLSSGEINISISESIKGVFLKSSEYNNSVINTIRLPRTLVGLFIGAMLSCSGLLTSIALKNPLADSGILGIQSGATIGALITLILIPSLINFLPIFSFIGGILSFTILVITSSLKKGFRPERIILIGVAINSMATSIIGIITITNSDKIKNALTWLNGSLANITVNEMKIIVFYSIIFISIVFISMPILKILLLEDDNIKNIGYNPFILRFLVSCIAVILASISVSFSGIISFIGIIAPQIASKFLDANLKHKIIGSLLIGSILVVGTDVFQRIIFSPSEIPVGILIGILGAPMFIFLAGGKKYD